MRERAILRTSVCVLLLSFVVSSTPATHAEQAAAGIKCSVTWPGQEAGLEEFMRTAAVARLEDVPIGVTKPRRAVFETGGPVARAAWKVLPPSMRSGYRESYKAEIAAYLLDRMLDMHMVPPAVERKVSGLTGAAILWVENTKPWNKDNPPRGPEPAWSRQLSRMKLFDQLIANIDRNQGNLLYDDDWHLILIDHSRAFIDRKDLKGLAAATTIDRHLWQRMDALTADSLRATLGAWLGEREIAAMLSRRDRMREAIAKQVAERGEAAVFFQ